MVKRNANGYKSNMVVHVYHDGRVFWSRQTNEHFGLFEIDEMLLIKL